MLAVAQGSEELLVLEANGVTAVVNTPIVVAVAIIALPRKAARISSVVVMARLSSLPPDLPL